MISVYRTQISNINVPHTPFLPQGARAISCAPSRSPRGNDIDVWWQVDTSQPESLSASVIAVPTGSNNILPHHRFVGTVIDNDGFHVWHVFQIS